MAGSADISAAEVRESIEAKVSDPDGDVEMEDAVGSDDDGLVTAPDAATEATARGASPDADDDDDADAAAAAAGAPEVPEDAEQKKAAAAKSDLLANIQVVLTTLANQEDE